MKKLILLSVIMCGLSIQVPCKSSLNFAEQIAMLRSEFETADQMNDKNKIEFLNKLIAHYEAKAGCELERAQSKLDKYYARSLSKDLANSEGYEKKVNQYQDKINTCNEILLSLKALKAKFQKPIEAK
jgi:hypothetical protein